jgi:hypothetical protein
MFVTALFRSHIYMFIISLLILCSMMRAYLTDFTLYIFSSHSIITKFPLPPMRYTITPYLINLSLLDEIIC